MPISDKYRERFSNGELIPFPDEKIIWDLGKEVDPQCLTNDELIDMWIEVSKVGENRDIEGNNKNIRVIKIEGKTIWFSNIEIVEGRYYPQPATLGRSSTDFIKMYFTIMKEGKRVYSYPPRTKYRNPLTEHFIDIMHNFATLEEAETYLAEKYPEQEKLYELTKAREILPKTWPDGNKFLFPKETQKELADIRRASKARVKNILLAKQLLMDNAVTETPKYFIALKKQFENDWLEGLKEVNDDSQLGKAREKLKSDSEWYQSLWETELIKAYQNGKITKKQWQEHKNDVCPSDIPNYRKVV